MWLQSAFLVSVSNFEKIIFAMLPKKWIKGALSGLRQFLAIESPLKMMKNVFYFTSKVIFIRKIFKFFSWLFGHVMKNGLIRKVRLISKFMTSQPGKQIIVIHRLPNIPRSKGNHAMKFGQLAKYNMRNIVFEKSFTKCGSGTILKPFSKKSKLGLSLEQ